MNINSLWDVVFTSQSITEVSVLLFAICFFNEPSSASI